MEFKVKRIEYGKDDIIYVPVFADKSLGILEEFLITESVEFKMKLLKALEDNETSKTDFLGRTCFVVIGKNLVSIESLADNVEPANQLRIEKEKFEQVIKTWLEKAKD